MTKERLKSPRARLFVALELPRSAHDALGEWQRALKATAPDDLRLVPDEALHVTLAFLGYRAERDIPAIEDVLAATVAPGGEVAFGFEQEPVAKPPRRPKIYAAAIAKDGSVAVLRAAIAEALTGAGLFEDERREFWPHVTLARVKRSAGHHRAPAQLPAAPAGLAESYRSPAVTLFRSHLDPAGARYEALMKIDLAAGE